MGFPQSNIDWAKYMDGLQGKANIDLDNLSEIGKSKLSGVPDYTAGIMYIDPEAKIVDRTEQTKIMPSKGVFVCRLLGFNNTRGYVMINGQLVLDTTTFNNSYLACPTDASFLVDKGDVVAFKPGYDSNAYAGKQFAFFFPMKGEK